MKKLNPYSPDGVHSALYYHFVQEWKGLSKVKNKSENKNFSDLLKELIKDINENSELFFEKDVVKYSERLIKKRRIQLSEHNARSKDTTKIQTFHQKIIKANELNSRFNVDDYRAKLKKRIEDKYDFINELEPKKINSINDDNIIESLKNIQETKENRFNKFNGLPYKMKNKFHFIDYTSAPVCYYIMKKNNFDYVDVFLDSVVSYCIKINEVKKTKEIVNTLNKANESGVESVNDFKDLLLNDASPVISTTPNRNHNAQINSFLSKNKSKKTK